MNGTVIVKDNVVVTVWEAGMLVKTYHVHNTWDTAGLNALRNWFAGLGGTPITHIAWVDTAGVERARDIVTQRLVTADKAVMFRVSPVGVIGEWVCERIRACARPEHAVRGDVRAVGVAKASSSQITVEWT